MTDQQPEALLFADDRPTSICDDLHQWAMDAEAVIRAQHARIAELEARIAQQAAPPFGWFITKSKLPGDVEFTKDPARENLARSCGYQTQALYAQPAAQGVALDAARWRMTALISHETMIHPDKRKSTEVVAAYMHAVHSGLDIQCAVDSALAAQAKHGGA